jgi:5'-nucleotidase-like protein
METFLTRAFAITLCLLIGASTALGQEQKPTPSPSPSPTPQLSVIYTGKLMGYFRSPSLQPSNLKGCPSGAKPSNAAAVVLGQTFPKNAILVGTGENFSPQLEARTFSAAPQRSGAPAGRFPPVQKELYSWYEEDSRWVFYKEIDEKKYPVLHQRLVNGTNTIPSDNVACYLAAAGYVAVVPGKHDFYFGPERLRQLARFMADKSANGLNPVQMLGANIVIKSSLINPHEVAEDDKKWEWPKKFSLLNVADGNEVYPWLTHARVKLTEYALHSKFPVVLSELLNREVNTEAQLKVALGLITEPELQADKKTLEDLLKDLASQHVYVCPAGQSRSEINIKPECELDKDNRTFRVIGDTVVADLNFKLHGKDELVLDPNTNYELALGANPIKTCMDKDVSCIRFRTRFPFFHFTDSKTGSNPDPKRFVYIPEKNVVIFGVVDQSLGEQVGVLNFSWRNQKPENSTTVSVEDPIEALQTQLDFFDRTYPEFDGIKVLLAQMSPERARKLGAYFPQFQIVISEADREQSTSELDSSTTWVQGPHAKAFVAVPAPYFDSEQRYRFEGIVHLGRVDVTQPTEFRKEKFGRNISKTAAWKLSSPRTDPQGIDFVKPVYATGAGPSFLTQMNNRFKKCQENADPADAYNRIQLLTLCLMREQLSADVALIQKRDFFNELPDPDITDPLQFQQALDRIIWKGDLLSLLYVPGSALKNVLDQSKKFDGEDGNALSLADERARGLKFIGVRFDSKSGNYIINELPLDDNKIYAVATTDYVSAGDTGYPQLSSKALNPKNRADKFPRELIPISSLVCRGLFANQQSALPYCISDLETQKYLDETNAKVDPAGPAPGFGTKVAAFFKPTKQSFSDPFKLDDNVQRRPIWVLSLKNLSFTVSSLSHNMSDEDIGDKFGGVPASGVTANKTYTIGEKSEIRFSRFSHDYEFFIGSNVDYKVQSTGDENPKVDQLENRVTPEAGMVRNLKGGRGPSRLGATFTFHTEVPLAKPFTVFKLSGDNQLKITQPRRVLILPRLGLRWQNASNYFEGGGQVGREYKALSGYRFDTTNEVCLPNAKETFADCISRLNKTTPASITKDTGATPIVESRNRIGLYWRSNFSIPFGSKFKYEFTDEGNFFFNSHGDNVSDTRLWDSQKHALKIAVFSSLSIGPSYQLIFFRNKINNDFLLQKQFGIETSFAFDVFNRRERKVQLMHKP